MEEGGRNIHGYKKGLWTAEEDIILTDYIKVHGKGKWNRVTKLTELKRCGKSCRLRWMNYLNPIVKRGDFSEEENDLIIRLHNLLGNSWSLIAGRVPGRTDNQVKNHWNSHLSKKLGVVKTKPNKTRRSSKSKANTTTSDQSQAISPKEKSKSLVEPPLLPKEDSNCGGGSDGYKEAVLQGGHDHCGMWETMMMGTTSNNDYEGSFWFYNNNKDDDLGGLFKNNNYFIDHPSLDYSFDSLDDIAF